MPADRLETALGAGPEFADVSAAARRLRGVAHRTPVLTSRTLDARAEARVFLKCENLQRMGAFKFRGAYNRIVQLASAEREAGVVAFSSGNHAQGVALAAQLLDVPATIVMPSDAPASKIAATREYGAEIVWYDRRREDRVAIAERIARERSATLIPSFDDAAIIAGAGTAALELFEDTPDLDALVVPLGGGGLLSGSLLATRALRGNIDVWGVEPETGDDFGRSLAAGVRLAIELPPTIADGLQTTMPGRLTFALIQALGGGATTVSDEQLRAAVRFAFERLKIVLEPSGAAALAAILNKRVDVRGRRVGIILSGGNVDPATFAAILAGEPL